MKKKKIIFIAAFLLLVLAAVFLFRDNIVRGILSEYLARQLGADVDIAKARIDSNYNISIESLRIRNDDGLDLHADSGILRFSPLYFLKQGVRLNFKLQGVRFSYIDSKIIHNVFEVLSLARIDELEFYSARGEFSYQAGRLLLKSLYLDGELLRIDAYGITDDTLIDFSIKLFLSKVLTSGMPESIRKVFFKQEGDWSNADLKITGSRDNPSINFSTDLFMLSVN